jgi:PAS domain S-box-containing protein
MTTRFGIFARLALALSVCGVCILLVSGWLGYRAARASLAAEATHKLTAVREMKAQQIEDYFDQIRNQVISLSSDPIVIEMARALPEAIEEAPSADNAERASARTRVSAYYERNLLPKIGETRPSAPELEDLLPDRRGLHLQDLYIASNPHPNGQKQLLESAGDGGRYSALHRRLHPTLKAYQERFGYYDIFIIEPKDGRIVYSVFKEVDFGTSLRHGPFSDSNLGEAFRAAAATESSSFTTLVDYAAYLPSYDEPAAFVASPIFDGQDLVGVLAFQMPVDRIDDVMTSHRRWSDVGLGTSGETYLVGSDSTLRSQSRFLIEDRDSYLAMISGSGTPESTVAKIRSFGTSIGLQKVETPGTSAALGGERGTATFADYRGVQVLSSYRPVDLGSLRWALMSEVDEAEALAPADALLRRVATVAIPVILLLVLLTGVISRSFTRPLGQLAGAARSLEDGDLDSSIHVNRTDEIGDLGRSFESMRATMQSLVGELRESNETLEARVTEQTAKLRVAHERIEGILHNASDGVVVHDGDGIITMFNPKAEEIFGYRAVEILGKSIDDLVPDDLRAGHSAKVRGFAAEGTTSRRMGEMMEIEGRQKDGRLFPAEVGISLSRTHGEVAMTAFVRDITERRRLEAELRDAFQIIKAQKDRMEGELNVARDIQMSMLPLIFPAFPDRREFEVHARLTPAREVGGDFYDFFFIDERRFCFCVGDVSDKGVPAALFMAVTKTLLNSRAKEDQSTASIVTHLNDELSRGNDASMFVTAFVAIFDLASGEMTYTNAGHNPPYLHRGGQVEPLGERHGPVIGAVGDIAYGESTVVLTPGDMAYLYTDGVTEATNTSGELFGDDRLAALLRDDAGGSTEVMVARVADAVHRFETGAEQADDITILAFRYVESLEDTHAQRLLKLRLRNEISQVGVGIDEVDSFLSAHGLEARFRSRLSVVLDELLNNIVSYAYEDDDEHEILLVLELSGPRLVLTISDDGIPFNAFAAPPPDTSASLEEREIGGLGIHIVRELMDEVDYHRGIGRNIVTVTKRLDRESPSS